MEWGRKWHVDFNAEKTVLLEQSSFKMLELIFFSKSDWALTFSLLLKLLPRKLEL